VTLRLHHQRPAITTLRADLGNNVWAAQYEQRLDDTHVKQQADLEDGQPYAQSPLPRVAKVKAPPDHMDDPRDDGDHRQHDVREIPYPWGILDWTRHIDITTSAISA